jgi:predicted DNA-binding transcriptional regulator YafY
VTVHAPASVVSERLSAVAGRIEELDAGRCVVHAGAESLEGLAFHFGFLGFDFEVHEPQELIEHLRRLAERFARASKRTVTGPA